MSNVSALPGCSIPTHEPNAALCDGLRDLLASAESGELQCMVGTGFMADGCRMGIWLDASTDVYRMLGAIGWLQAEYVHRHTEAVG